MAEEHEKHHEEKKHSEHQEHKEHDKPHQAEHEKSHHEHDKPHSHERAEHHHEAKASQEKSHPAKAQDPERKELMDSRVSVIAFAAAGALMALVSSFLKAGGVSSWLTVPIGFILLGMFIRAMARLMGRKGKFFMSGAFVYLFTWLVIWILISQPA